MSPEIRREAAYWERVDALQRTAATILKIAGVNPEACLRGLIRLREEMQNVAPPPYILGSETSERTDPQR